MHDCMFARYTVRQFLDLQSILSNLGEKTTRGSLTHIPKLFAPHHVCTYHWQQKTQMATAIVSFWSLSLIVLHFFLNDRFFPIIHFVKKKSLLKYSSNDRLAIAKYASYITPKSKWQFNSYSYLSCLKKNLESILGTKKKSREWLPVFISYWVMYCLLLHIIWTMKHDFWIKSLPISLFYSPSGCIKKIPLGYYATVLSQNVQPGNGSMPHFSILHHSFAVFIGNISLHWCIVFFCLFKAYQY